MTDPSDWNRDKAINALEEVPRTDDKYAAREKALDALAATPNEEIEALIEEWRERANEVSHPPEAATIEALADELEARLQ